MSLLSALFVRAAAAQGENVAIQASDLDRSATFYREAFGLRAITTPLTNRRWFDLGHGFALHLLPRRT